MIESTNNKVAYVVANNPVFAFPIRFLAPSDIHCYLCANGIETELARGTDFSVESKSDYSSGANVTLLGPLAPGSKLVIARVMPMTQDVNLPEYGKLPSAAAETQLDKIVMICQQFKEELARCIKISIGSDQTPEEFLQGFITTVTGAKDIALNASVSAANSAASASGVLTIIGQIMSELTGDDRYRTQTFDVLGEIWQAKGAIEAAAEVAMGDITSKCNVSIAAVETATSNAKNAATAAIQQNVSSAIVDANAAITANVNAAIGANEVFSSAYTVAQNDLNAAVTSAIADAGNVVSSYVTSAQTAVSSAVTEWGAIHSAAVAGGSSALADIASARLSAYNEIGGQVSLASAYVSAGGQQVSTMSGYLNSAGGLLTSVTSNVGVIYSSAAATANASLSAHNLSPAAHSSGFNHNITLAFNGTPSVILDSTNADNACHLHYNGDRFYVLFKDKSTGDWVNTQGFNIEASTGLVSMKSPALTGTATASTAAAGTNTTQIATTAFVHNHNTADMSAHAELLTRYVPPGTILPFAASVCPAWFLICNGAAVSRTTYAALFTKIGTTYGAGDGSTTFNLPDLRGKFLRGYLANTTAAIGTAQAESLPNITGWVGCAYHGNFGSASGAFAIDDNSEHQGASSDGGIYAYTNVTFNASRCNSIYNGTHVTPANYAVLFIIKY